MSTEFFAKEVFSKELRTYKLVERNQLAYNPSRINVGSIALQDIADEVVVSPLYIVFAVDASRIDSSYLLRYLKSKPGLKQVEFNSIGTVRNNLKYDGLCQISVPLPSLEVQRSRVCSLIALETEIKEGEETLSKLDALVKSRFVEMFGDPKLEPNKWSTKTLGEVCATRLGKMLDAKKQTGKCSYPYLANTNVQWFHFDLTDLRQMDFSDEDRIEFGLKNGDIMVTEGGEIGRCAIWREEIPNCYFQKAVHRVRCDSEVLLPEYFVWCFKMKANLGLFESYVSQSTIAHLTGKKIKQVPIPLPPLSLQREFAAFVARVDKSRFVVRNKSQL